MALTKVSTDGVKDDAITSGKIPANAVGASELADDAVTAAKLGDNAVVTANIANFQVTTNKIANQAVDLTKLPHGTSSNDGKFLRANNGADPSFETVNTDLVSDPSPQLGGTLDSNGNVISLGDATGVNINRIKLGADNDLHIYHNGTNSTIREEGDGDLLLHTNNGSAIKLTAGSDENMVVANKDGAVDLYHNGTKKCETTVNGLKLSNLPDNSFMLLDQNGRQSALNNYFSSGSTNSRIGVDISTGTTDGAKTRSVDFWPDGMSFNGDTASANRINDYEEGSFTPIIKFNQATNNQSYNYQMGRYTKIGNRVLFHLYVAFSNKGTASGYARVYGLPYTSANVGVGYAHCSVWVNNSNFGNAVPTGYVPPNQNYFHLERQATNGAGIYACDNTNFNNSTDMMISGSYIV